MLVAQGNVSEAASLRITTLEVSKKVHGPTRQHVAQLFNNTVELMKAQVRDSLFPETIKFPWQVGLLEARFESCYVTPEQVFCYSTYYAMVAQRTG